jgi:hypothetical protein
VFEFSNVGKKEKAGSLREYDNQGYDYQGMTRLRRANSVSRQERYPWRGVMKIERFRVAAADRGRVVTLEFDGVYRNCEVWING